MAPLTVLVVGYDADTMELLKTMLEDLAGFAVTTAADCQKALRLARDTLPDLAIVDISPLVPDGLEFSLWLRTDPRTATIPLIAISTWYFSCLRQAQSSFNCFISKPFDVDNFMAEVQRVLPPNDPPASMDSA